MSLALRTWWVAPTLLIGLLAALLPTSNAAFSNPTSNDGNAFQTRQPIRVTTYQIPAGAFTGTTYTLTLNQDLATDYFVILRGGAGNNTGSGTVGPNADYARVSGDPFGTGGLTDLTGNAALELTRGANTHSWQGQVTVLESPDSQATAGFTLLDVAQVTFTDASTTGAVAISQPWGSGASRVGLYGGSYGGGVQTVAAAAGDHMTAWGRIYPTDSNVVNVQRRAGGGGAINFTTTFTVYAVEWGAEWTIQRRTITGTAGGQGANNPWEYNTTAIASVVRENTFVVASGRSADNGIGDGFEGAIWTLGNGVSQNTNETTVALGSEYTDWRQAEIYVHEHPRIFVEYDFGTDGGSGIPNGALTGTQAVSNPQGPESRSGHTTAGYRFALISNTSNGQGTAYPRPLAWARHTADATITWTRSRSGQPGAYWMQSVDFGGLWAAP